MKGHGSTRFWDIVGEVSIAFLVVMNMPFPMYCTIMTGCYDSLFN